MKDYINKDLYAVLGLQPEFDMAKIKAVYRKLVRKYHPDISPDSEEKFKEIQEAYEILSDSEKKSRYDLIRGIVFTKTSHSTSKTQAKRAYEETVKNQKSEGKTAQQTAEKKENKSFSKVFNDILDEMFTSKNSAKTPPKPRKNGTDVTTGISISVKEALLGTNRTINILHTEVCPNCYGKKFINGTQCQLCKGKGEISIHKKINVKIPPNIKNNSKIRIANEGNKGINGGKNGDLYLVLTVDESKKFKTEGLDIKIEIPITPYQAALGATINVESPNGEITMKIPPNTTSNQKFRLSEQGLIDKKSDKKGDMIVTVRIEMPKNLSEEELKLYKELEKVANKIESEK